MKLTGQDTRSIFDRYAILDESMLNEARERLAALNQAPQTERQRHMVPLRG